MTDALESVISQLSKLRYWKSLSLMWRSSFVDLPRRPTDSTKLSESFHTPCPIPSWKVLIHRTDNLIMRRTYYWYYAAEARLPWSPSERHLIFSPPSSLSMGPSVVENEFSLICMTDKHILYLSHRRSYAMDLGTKERERKRVRGWNDAWSYLYEGGKWGICVCLSVIRAQMCACVCIMHGHVMFMYALLSIPMPWLCSHGKLLNLHKHMPMCVFVYVPTIMNACSNFVRACICFHNVCVWVSCRSWSVFVRTVFFSFKRVFTKM